MARLFFLAMSITICCIAQPQIPIGSMQLPITIKSNSKLSPHWHKETGEIIINTGQNQRLERWLYDSSYKLIGNYTTEPPFADIDGIAYHPSELLGQNIINGKYYELYSAKGKLVLLQLDFLKKKDSIILSMDFNKEKKGEQGVSAIFYSNAVRILTYRYKTNELIMYQWQPDKGIDFVTMNMPVSSLSDEELKKYDKEYKINYKKSTGLVSKGYATSSTINESNSEDKIRVFFNIQGGAGYNMLEIDAAAKKVLSFNFIINDMRYNMVEASAQARRNPFPCVYNDFLIIRNTSDYYFEYVVFDLRTHQKVASHKTGSGEELRTLVQSDFLQIGTWGSKKEEKELDNEKAFLRKLSSGIPILQVTKDGEDSLLITTGSIIPTEGIGGFLLSMSTAFLTSMANLRIGSAQVILYLTLFRNKLILGESKFSLKDFQPSPLSRQPLKYRTDFDNPLLKELGNRRSFALATGEKTIFGFYNPEKKQFDLYTLNDQ